MAYGISAFYILTNENVNLISIDPFQSTQWNNYGVNLLKEFKHRNLIVKCLLDKDKNRNKIFKGLKMKRENKS